MPRHRSKASSLALTSVRLSCDLLRADQAKVRSGKRRRSLIGKRLDKRLR